jgi:hypothetical protein
MMIRQTQGNLRNPFRKCDTRVPTSVTPLRIGEETTVANPFFIVKPVMQIQAVDLIRIKPAEGWIVPGEMVEQMRLQLITLSQKNNIGTPSPHGRANPFADMVGVKSKPAEMDFFDREGKLGFDMPTRVVIGPNRDEQFDVPAAPHEAGRDLLEINPTPAGGGPMESQIDEGDTEWIGVWIHVIL